MKMACTREQKMAYNILFTDAYINKLTLKTVLEFVDKYHGPEMQKKHKNIDIDAIKRCVSRNYEQYTKKPFIADSYEEIRDRLPL
jgi:hypothetical protein